MSKANQIDMTEGPVLVKLLKFSVPLILSSVLQLLFNAADIVVVGRFAGDNSLAAVGSTGSLINLLVNLFMGLSTGTNVVAAHYFGAGKSAQVQDTVHTAMLLSVMSGIILTAAGVLCARPILVLMQAPGEVLNLAAIYLRIYFGGITAMMIYNFGSALLRAKGDTQRPLRILFASGILNVILNLIFVIVFKMDVAGVAWATIISQGVSAAFVVLILLRETDDFRLYPGRLKIKSGILSQIVRIGMPAGFQGIVFSFSNVIIQSSVNSFGASLIAGNSAACNLEGFVYTSMNGFSQGSLTFCSQNMGAHKYDRIKRITVISQVTVFIVGLVLGILGLLFSRPLLGIYTSSPSVIEAGLSRLVIIFTTYYLCGMMDAMSNSIRGMGHSLLPAIITMIGACGLRLAWLATVFQAPSLHTPATIFLSYPISWLATYIVLLASFIVIFRKLE